MRVFLVVNCFQNCIFTYDSQLAFVRYCSKAVVNCFQNCIFTYDSQLFAKDIQHPQGCELLSELYFYLWFPTSFGCGFCLYWLWIALSHLAFIFSGVRWFLIQNCIFTYDSQHNLPSNEWNMRCELLSELYFYLWFPTQPILVRPLNGCELLSELYFYLWFPTKLKKQNNWILLWIAFRIVFLLMIPNNRQ